MLNWLLRLGPLSGVADRFGGGDGGSLAGLTDALKDEKDKKSNPMDRLQDAFKQLKDMHKDDKPFDFESAQWPFGPIGAPSSMDNAQWPHGPVGAPSQAMASASAPAAVPLPMARPAEAPRASSPFADFFARNTAMMQDPNGGGYIDPQAAAKAGPGILNSMFG
jgi:hypothetical protein